MKQEPSAEERREALAKLRKLHAEILARRAGVPIDVDALLDEVRRRDS